MTRINCVPPAELCDQHLLAEIRELPRVFELSRKAHERGFTQTVPEYTMGKGHVTFFYDKLVFLKIRFAKLRLEAARRGFKTTGYRLDHIISSETPFIDWEPDEKALEINRARLYDRLIEMKREPRWHKKDPNRAALLNIHFYCYEALLTRNKSFEEA